MQIALVTSSYAPHFGGVEEHVRQVAHELSGQGAQVEVWAVDRGTGVGVQNIDGVTVRYLPTPLPARKGSALAQFALAAPVSWRMWRSAYREFTPDLLHVQCFGPNGVYALALHRKFGVPLAVTSHGETLGDDNSVYSGSALLRRTLTESIARAKFVTAPSEYVLRDLREHYGVTGGEVVVNGVDLCIVPTHESSSPEPHLFAVGRLGRMKGFDLLIDAFADAAIDEVRLKIAGDGDELVSLRARALARGVGDRIDFLGRLTSQQVADRMAGALAVVVPSRSEAFGIVALEAWRSGAPLVMTNRGGGSEFVRDGEDGLLVDPENTVALAEVLTRIVRDRDLATRMAQAGRARVGEFTWASVAEQYRSLYAKALDSQGLTS